MKTSAIVFLAASGIISCGTSDQAPEATPTTLELANWFSTNEDLSALQKVIDGYTVHHPSVSVVLKPLSTSGKTRASQLDPSDPASIGSWDLGLQTLVWMSSTVGLDLDDEQELAGLKHTISPLLFPTMIQKDHWIGVPLDVFHLNSAFFSSEALKKLGFDGSVPGSLSDYEKLCKNYADGGGEQAGLPYPLAAPVSANANENTAVFTAMLFALLDSSVTLATSTDPASDMRPTLELLQYYSENGCLNQVADSNGNNAATDETLDSLMSGSAAVVLGFEWYAGYLSARGKAPGKDIILGKPLSTGASLLNGDYLVLNSEAKQPAVAAQFAAQALSPQTQLTFAAAHGVLPALKFEHPETDIPDPSLRTNYLALQEDYAAGRALPPPSWISFGKGTSMKAFIDSKGTAPDATSDDVVKAILCAAPAYPSFANSGGSAKEDCPNP